MKSLWAANYSRAAVCTCTCMWVCVCTSTCLLFLLKVKANNWGSSPPWGSFSGILCPQSPADWILHCFDDHPPPTPLHRGGCKLTDTACVHAHYFTVQMGGGETLSSVEGEKAKLHEHFHLCEDGRMRRSQVLMNCLQHIIQTFQPLGRRGLHFGSCEWTLQCCSITLQLLNSVALISLADVHFKLVHYFDMNLPMSGHWGCECGNSDTGCSWCVGVGRSGSCSSGVRDPCSVRTERKEHKVQMIENTNLMTCSSTVI